MHKPSARRLQRIQGDTRRIDLGAPLPYPWRERAKPLGGRVADHFVGYFIVLCCVVLCVVFFVVSDF